MKKDATGLRIRKYSSKEELANTLSHGAGILLGLIAGFILLKTASASSSGWAVVSVIVYLSGMLFSYLSSTCYHGCTDTNRKALLRKFDHSAIYFHIAGTYTPFTLVVLRDAGAWGWSIFVFIWLAAICGTILSFRKLKTHSHLETICFVVMGCTIFVAFKPLVDVLSSRGQLEALFWLLAGGVSYIVGAIFYSWTKKKYMHTVFHIFVLAGSVCHIVAIDMICSR